MDIFRLAENYSYPLKNLNQAVLQHLKKIWNILLIITRIASLALIAVTIFIGTAMGKRVNTDFENDNNIQIIKPEINPKINKKLIKFLESPIDLQEFKNMKKMRFTTSVTNGMNYYFHPKVNDSIFYSYYYPSEKIIPQEIDKIIVFKYGENKHTYKDETEILIELRIFNQDSDLEKANLVGLTKTELETKFGSDYLTLDNRIIYSNKNKVLILDLDNSKVKSFNYIKLSTEKIDSDLIKRIAE